MLKVPGNLAVFAILFTFVTKLQKLERWFDDKFRNKKNYSEKCNRLLQECRLNFIYAKLMRLSSYSCFRVALRKSQVMTSFRPPMFFPGGVTDL